MTVSPAQTDIAAASAIAALMSPQHNTAPCRIRLQAAFVVAQSDLFAHLADFESMPRWFPLLRRVTTDHTSSQTAGKCDVGSVRLCTLRGFGTLREAIVLWHPPHTFAYRIDDPSMPFTDHLAVMHIQARGDRSCTLYWAQHFRDRGVIKRFFCPAAMRWLMSGAMRNLQRSCGG